MGASAKAVSICLLICWMAGAQVATKKEWSGLTALSSGETIKVKLRNGKPVTGRFAGLHDADIVVRTRQGEHVIPKTDIQRISVRRPAAKYAPLIGLATGFGVMVGILGNGGDLVASGYAAYLGAGAGIGYLGGWLVGKAAPDKVVYDASP